MSAVKRLLCLVGLHPYEKERSSQYALFYRCPCCAQGKWVSRRRKWGVRQTRCVIKEVPQREAR